MQESYVKMLRGGDRVEGREHGLELCVLLVLGLLEGDVLMLQLV